MSDQDSTPRLMVEALIKTHGSKKTPSINLHNFPSRFTEFVVDKSTNLRSNGVRKGINNLMNGHTKTINETTRIRLSDFWRPAIDGIEADWFKDRTIAEFYNLIQFDDSYSATVEIPKASEEVFHHFHRDFVGKTFITYRYGFDGRGKIARELFHVFEKDNEIKFNFYTQIYGERKYHISTGGLWIVGDNIHFVGAQDGDVSDPARLRHLILKKELQSYINRYRIGILLGSAPNPTQVGLYRDPVAVKIWLTEKEKVGEPTENEIEEIVRFISSDELVTGSAELDALKPETLNVQADILNFIANEPDGNVLIAKTDNMNQTCARWHDQLNP